LPEGPPHADADANDLPKARTIESPMTESRPTQPSPGSGDGRGAQPVPFHREAEDAVIGSVLVNAEVYFDLANFLTPTDFFLHRNRWVWEAFAGLHEQRLPVDVLTVAEELERQGRLDEVGGPAYLTELIHSVPTSLHAEAYGRLVEETAIRRRLIEAAQQVARLAYQSETPIEDAVNEAEKAVFGVSERRLTHQLQPIRQVLSEFYDRMDYLARHQDETIGVPTGFIDLDRVLGGSQPSNLLISAGRRGQGKSGFCLTVPRTPARSTRSGWPSSHSRCPMSSSSSAWWRKRRGSIRSACAWGRSATRSGRSSRKR